MSCGLVAGTAAFLSVYWYPWKKQQKETKVQPTKLVAYTNPDGNVINSQVNQRKNIVTLDPGVREVLTTLKTQGNLPLKIESCVSSDEKNSLYCAKGPNNKNYAVKVFYKKEAANRSYHNLMERESLQATGSSSYLFFVEDSDLGIIVTDWVDGDPIIMKDQLSLPQGSQQLRTSIYLFILILATHILAHKFLCLTIGKS